MVLLHKYVVEIGSILLFYLFNHKFLLSNSFYDHVWAFNQLLLIAIQGQLSRTGY